MISNDARKILTNIICGNVIEGQSDLLTAARNYLCKSFATNTKIKKEFNLQSAIKEKQKAHLIDFINSQHLWYPAINEENYLTEGGEAKIYFGADHKTVLKLNDAVYYNNWLDYFNSILIHNLFFDRTLYTLKGFIQKDEVLFAVAEQPFIVADKISDVKDI